MKALIEFFRSVDVNVIALLLSIPRMHAFLAASQLLNNSVVPGVARTAIIVVLILFVAPVNEPYAEQFDKSPITFAMVFAKEYVIGYLLGWLVGWTFWAISAAGAFIDNQRGTAIASSIDPMQGEESSTLGNLFSLAFVTYAFVSAAILTLLATLYESFALWPLNKMFPPLSAAFATHFLLVFDLAMRTMFMLAGPIVAVMFLAEFSLAIVSRFAPQVQVFILAMPIKSLIAIMMLLFYGSVMFEYANKLIFTSSSDARLLYKIFESGEAKGEKAPP
jgi:type III secretion protein T